ncbi:hypothetical protein O4J56_04475 [Nocardiopsis sp. RSe5-2]|uniref:Sigma-70 family RNA polymerase sigma factor n=1 Tax=Nocardiopsis endophytica TaxID=3018445 RepID=A0ABT4U059_9ACTN|nr:hypothetical protein [Nocardiopsis endophytica]MDA2809884.1 hypothetical protein [Nocardiopsis endophytica]
MLLLKRAVLHGAPDTAGRLAMPTTPFSTLHNALALLLDGSGQPGSELAELIGMPPHDLSAAAATHQLLKADRTTADEVWRGIITRAREGDPAWTVIAAGLALPGLAAARRRLCRDLPEETADVEAEMLTAFLTELKTITPATQALCPKLIYAARKAAQRHRYRILRNRHRTTDFEEENALAPAPSSDGPVTLLATHVRNGLLSATEAELIARTRLERAPLARAASELGLTYITARRYRQQAQVRIAEALNDTEIPESMSA